MCLSSQPWEQVNRYGPCLNRTGGRTWVRRELGVNQSRQTALDEVMPRAENAGEKICKKGLDNSGNIEGNSHGLFTPPRRPRAPQPPPPAGAACSPAAPGGARSGQVPLRQF